MHIVPYFYKTGFVWLYPEIFRTTNLKKQWLIIYQLDAVIDKHSQRFSLSRLLFFIVGS